MKKLLLALLLIPCLAQGQVVTLEKFDLLNFIVDKHAAPTNVISLDLSSFTNLVGLVHQTNYTLLGGAGITVTSVIVGTNGTMTIDSLWSNNASVFTPSVAQNQLIATNINSAQTLVALGALLIPSSLQSVLTNGENDLNPYQVGYIWATSATNTTDPSLSTVKLSSGNGQGQLLFIENYTTLSITNSAFTMVSGPLWDSSGDLTLQNGPWTPTHSGETMLLQNDGRGWREVARFFGAAGGQGNDLWTAFPQFIAPTSFTNNMQIQTNGGASFGSDGQISIDPDARQMQISGIDGANGGLLLFQESFSDAMTNTSEPSPPLKWQGNVWEPTAGAAHGIAFSAIANGVSIADPVISGGYWKLFFSNPGVTNYATPSFTLYSDSGWTGAGTKFLSDDGTYKAGGGGPGITNIFDTIIVTNLYITTNTFIVNNGGTNAVGLWEITNQVLRPVPYTNFPVGFERVGTDNRMTLLSPDLTTTSIRLTADDSGATGIGSVGPISIFSATYNVNFQTGYVYPIGANDLGQEAFPWANLRLNQTNFIEGFYDGLSGNYSRLAISHGGTNIHINIDSQSAGIAGIPRDIWLEFNGTEAYKFQYDANYPSMVVVDPSTFEAGYFGLTPGSAGTYAQVQGPSGTVLGWGLSDQIAFSSTNAVPATGRYYNFGSPAAPMGSLAVTNRIYFGTNILDYTGTSLRWNGTVITVP